MSKYTFTDKDNMVGKKPRQIYWTELQDAVNDSADKIDILSTKVSPEIPLNTTSQNLSGAVNEVKNEIDEHKADKMPHLIKDEDTGKTYRVGRRFKDGGMQKIWEEVI